jgi:hypothetical protein
LTEAAEIPEEEKKEILTAAQLANNRNFDAQGRADAMENTLDVMFF